MLMIDFAGDGNSRKRGRPTKPLKGSGKVLESPTQSAMPHSSQAMPPQTPQQQNAALPPPVIVTPSQTSPPPKSTPTKTVVKALPTVRDHTTDQLGPEGDEYIPREYDEAGEKKVTATGHLNDNREYKCRTFFVPNRGNKLFMLATECARVLGYRDSYLLFNKNRSLYKIIATQTEKEDLIQQEILPFSYRSRQIAIVTAKSMFRQFGSRVIVNGRRVRDDYWESKARKQGFTEADLAGEKRPGGAKARDAAAAEAANASAMLSHQGDIVYSTAPVHFGAHPQPQTVQPGMMGPPIGGTPLPMIVGPDQNDMRLGEYRNVSRPRQEISGPAYQDRTQPSPTTEVLTQSHHAADYNQQVNQQRKMRGEYIGEIWRQPHDLPASAVPPSTSISENLQPVTQSLQTTHQSGSSVQQPLLSNQSSQHMQAASYTQAPSQQASQSQTPMRNMSQSSIRPDQMHGRSPNIPLASTGLGQNAASYGFSPQTQTPMWAPAQPQQSPQHFSSYPTQVSHQSPHLQHSTHQQPPHLRQSGSNPQIQPGIPYQSMGQGYPQSRGMYQPDQVPQQYLQQAAQAPQSAAQSWTPQQPHSASQGSWGWGTQG
jgi:hypothetical protein